MMLMTVVMTDAPIAALVRHYFRVHTAAAAAAVCATVVVVMVMVVVVVVVVTVTVMVFSAVGSLPLLQLLLLSFFVVCGARVAVAVRLCGGGARARRELIIARFFI
jgi:hypothetical protein